MTYEAADDSIYKEYTFLASIDFTAEKPAWTFTQIDPFMDAFGMPVYSNYKSFAADGKVYCYGKGRTFDSSEQTMYLFSYDVATGVWKREADPPIESSDPMICAKDGMIYLALGHIYSAEFHDNVHEMSNAVYCYEGESWTKNGEIPYIGDVLKADKVQDSGISVKGTCTAVKDGLMFFDCPTDGGGNVFLYHTDTGVCEPMYRSASGYKADNSNLYTAVETKDGIYYMKKYNDGYMDMFNLYLLPADSGAYTPSYPQKGLLGDANFDGEVDIVDATWIQRCEADMITLSDKAKLLADVDRDEEVCIIDATWLQRYEVGMKAPEGIGEPV